MLYAEYSSEFNEFIVLILIDDQWKVEYMRWSDFEHILIGLFR